MTEKPVATSLDPDNIQPRLYRQLGRILEDMEQGSDASLRERIEKELYAKRATDATLRERIEEVLAEVYPITTSERIRAFVAIARVLTVFAALRKENHEPGERGSAVRAYSKAFRQPAPHATRGRTRGARSAAIDAALAELDAADEDDTAD